MPPYHFTMVGRSFVIPVHPKRTYPYRGGLQYEGGTTFSLVPDDDWLDSELTDLVERILQEGPYRYGDFFNLPMPVYLVRDDETTDVFRVSVRDGSIRFHVLPETDSPGLQAMYRRLDERTEDTFHVLREVDESP